MAYEGLRHGGVHAVHRHVVPVVGRPAQCQLREVTGADNEATFLVRDIHQDLCPLTSLRILVGHVVHALIVPDIREVLLYGLRDVDLTQRDAERLSELLSIAACTLRCTEARHCHGDDARAVKTHGVKGLDGHKQCQCGVKPTGDADHRARGVGVT